MKPLRKLKGYLIKNRAAARNTKIKRIASTEVLEEEHEDLTKKIALKEQELSNVKANSSFLKVMLDERHLFNHGSLYLIRTSRQSKKGKFAIL